MDEEDRCNICSNKISKTMDICPHCGCMINHAEYHMESKNRYDYDRDKNLEYLEQMDITLCHLEEELDAFLCKKR